MQFTDDQQKRFESLKERIKGYQTIMIFLEIMAISSQDEDLRSQIHTVKAELDDLDAYLEKEPLVNEAALDRIAQATIMLDAISDQVQAGNKVAQA